MAWLVPVTRFAWMSGTRPGMTVKMARATAPAMAEPRYWPRLWFRARNSAMRAMARRMFSAELA
jgi:hypothetical protein